MADVSRSVYLSRKFSNVNEETSKHAYDGIFSAPAATNHTASSFAARIEEYREIFPPSIASLGSTIPILDLPASDRSVGLGRGVSSDFDYAGVFGALGDNDGIEVATERFFSDSRKSVKRDAHPPRIPVPTRRMPSKSQEFSFRHGNDQTSSPEKTKRIPSKSQEFSCNYGNDQTLSPAHRRVPSKTQEFIINHGNDQPSSSALERRVPSKSQEFIINHGNDQASISAQARRIPSPSQEVSSNYVNDQISSPGKTKSRESSGDPGNDQASIPAQTRRIPSKSQEFSCNYGNNEASVPAQPRRIPSKSQEFPCNYVNDQMSIPSHSKKQYSQSQEFPSDFSTNQIPTSSVQTRRPFSGTSPNGITSASALHHETVDSVKHVSFSYNKTNQLGKDSPNGTTHIAHLQAVPGYTHLFDESGPVRKPSFEKPKRLSMDDADFDGAIGKVSRQGKHLRAVSDLGTNQRAMDLDKEVNGMTQTRSMSMSNSPQSFGSSGYFKRSSRRKTNRSKNNQENIAYVDPFLLLEDELDVNSTAAVSAAAMKKAIEEAEVKIRWAKDFLKDLEGNGFIKPTLKDSFKVNVEVNAYGLKQNGSMKAKPTKQKKYFNEEKVLKQNSYLNSKASIGDSHANEAGEVKASVDLELTSQKQLRNQATGLKQTLDVLSAGLDTNVRSPATENCKEMNVNDELKFDEKRYKDESGGEWEAAKQLSQLFTGVKNRFVSFMSKQAETEKTVVQKDVQSKSEPLQQSRERPDEGEANLDRTVEMSTHDCIGTSIDVEACEAKDHELSTSGSTSSPDIEILMTKHCMVSEPEEEVECIEAHNVKQGIATEIKGEALQEVQEQNQETLDEKLEIQNENQMDTTVPVERDELEEKVYQSQERDNEMRNREDNEGIVDVVPDLKPSENGVDASINKEALTELEMSIDAERKQDVRMVEENCMIEECSERRVEEEATYGGVEDTEKITGQDVTIEAAECLTEVVVDDDDGDDDGVNLSATDELFSSRNQEASVPDTVNQYVEGMKLISEEKGRMTESATIPFELKEDVEQPQYVNRANELNGSVCEQTPCSIDVVDDDSDHEEYLPAVDDILEQDEASEYDIASQYAVDVDLPSQKERLTEATSSTFEHEGNTERPRSVEMADQLNDECISEDSMSHTEGADELSEHDDDYRPTADDLCEKDGPEEHKYAQEEVYVENDLIGEMKETSMSSGDVSDLDDSEKETKEVDDVSPSVDVEITELDSVLKYEQKLSDEDDESEEANEAANEQDASSHNIELSHKRRRWFVNTDDVANFQQPGIFQGTMEMDQENAVKDRDEHRVDETVNNSGEQADGDSDQDQRTEGLQSTEGSHRRRRWFENSTEKVEVKLDVSSETLDEKLVNERRDIAEDKAETRASTEAGHRRRRWFENGQKPEESDTTTKQELNETSSSEDSVNAQQQSEEQSKARERQAVERAIREARQRAFAEAKERANAVKAAASIQDRTGKPLSDKASTDAKLRAERAAVERATAEARERALQKSMSEKVIYKSREKVEFKNMNSGPSSSGHSTSVPFTSDRPSGAMTESPQRRKAISERNKRTTERAAKALEEKNMRDVLAQKEQAERNRFSGILDAEVKRWLTGKEGNLRSLLSTLQYVLGPDSGWQPIPLTDLVTTTAVRKAYKRAALCVHPDKLQQRRATIQQKYICEKVFDLLKDAWHKFNPDER